MGGIVGRFWSSMGLTATFAIMISLLVAFTLTPMLSARLLAAAPPRHGAGGGVYGRVEQGYERLVAWCLRHRALVLLLCLALFVSPYWLISIMGLFLLMGVVKKNAILQVDYTNTLRGRGVPRYEAQLAADRARLRPILMTTLATIAGLLPVTPGGTSLDLTCAAFAFIVARSNKHLTAPVHHP
ncbi:MAG: efflux RND transporter permease subunit [Nitrospinae bacterium]|nr:efflux RND transporter permease subunit [Nitrospinota bacterium]